MSDLLKCYDVFKNGSTWVKADFHLHTRKDKQFVYTDEDNSFLKKYVAKLKEQSIHIGVITNHNKFNKDEFIELRKNAKKEEILLLPGIELSVKDGANGIHTLVVFSDEWLEDGKDYINSFLTVAFEGRVSSEYEQEDGRSSFDIIETIKKLDNYHRDYFLIFAHVEQNSGLWKELKGGRLEELGKNEIFKNRTLAFQKVRTHDKEDGVCQTKVKKWLQDWYPAEVEGSDCKSIDEIGSKDGETWLKLGDFTFESIKYALRDYKNRVLSKQPEKFKHSYIKSIAFKGGVLDGKTIYFSPELNTFIGIRGSGKSSILEVIRYVLAIPFGERSTDLEYKKKLVAHTLASGGQAIITACDQYGSEFYIKRILNELPQVYVGDTLQPGVSIRETVIRKPIYFGQKDLSASGEGFEKDMVEKLVGEKLLIIRQKIADKKQDIIEIIRKMQKITNLDERISEYTKEKLDAEFNLKKFTEYGVEEKFKKQTDFEKDERKIIQIITDSKEYRDAFSDFIIQYEDTIKNNQIYSSSQNGVFFTDFFAEYKTIVDILIKNKTNKKAVDETIQKLTTKWEEFGQIKKDFTDKFAETRRKIEEELAEKGASSLNLEDYPALTKKIDTATKMLDALKKQKLNAIGIKKELLQTVSELNSLWHKEFVTIKDLLDIINGQHSALTIEGDFKGDKQEYLSFMKNIFRGSGIRESSLQSLVNTYADFGNMYADFDTVVQMVKSSQEKFEQYFSTNLQDLLTYQVQNKFTIKYKGKELKHHSLGQRASALMLFVLNQKENDVIIIDQPEDDLDNQTIYEDVIKLVRKLKPTTQFLFATHNANFPVLGDAEQIFSCRYKDNKIEIKSGSIDSPILQKEIVNIMEGGEDAFNKRKEIYGIWKPQSSSK